MSLMDVIAALQEMGKEIRANTADTEAATAAEHEYQKTAGRSKGSAGGSRSSSSTGDSSGSSAGRGNSVSTGALAAALKSVQGRTGA